MSMNVPPPEPSSAASAVEVEAADAAFEELGAAVDSGAAPIVMRSERRQARKERLRLLVRRPGLHRRGRRPAVLDRVRRRR